MLAFDHTLLKYLKKINVGAFKLKDIGLTKQTLHDKTNFLYQVQKSRNTT